MELSPVFAHGLGRSASAAPPSYPRPAAAAPCDRGKGWQWSSSVFGFAWMCSKVKSTVARSARQKLQDQIQHVQRYERGELSEFDVGVSTGLGLDHIFRPVRGEVITVTGRPGSGKSEFCLSIALRLAEEHGWKTGLCLFEHKADQLVVQLLEKKTRTNFRDQDLSQSSVDWISEHFLSLADFSDETLMDEILMKAAKYAEEGRLQNLVIDPYNYIAAPNGLLGSETSLVSRYMTQLKQFAKKYEVCVWVVVHPTKGSQMGDAKPSLYDLQGSAHWNNKCDKGLYLVRPNRDPSEGPTNVVEIHVLKVRNGDSGRVGMQPLRFRPDIRSFEELALETA